MSTTTILNAPISFLLFVLLIAALVPLAAADSSIYRCGPAGSQWFSQIPCEENSEQVIVEDHRMFSETEVSGTASDIARAEQGEAKKADAASKAQAFITQLEKQRNEQLAEIDRNINDLQARVEEADGYDETNADAGEAASSLASLQTNRESIQSEYEAMISAARQRIETP